MIKVLVFASILLTLCLGTVQIPPSESYRIILYKIFTLNVADNMGKISPSHIDIIGYQQTTISTIVKKMDIAEKMIESLLGAPAGSIHLTHPEVG